MYRQTKLIIATALLAATTICSHADTFPSKPIKMIVPFPPGGTTDIIARVVGDKLAKELGQPVIVENRGGAGGAIGALAISKADPDGHTIGLATVSTHAVNPACNRSVGYDPIRDFTPITNLARTPNVLTVEAKSASTDFKQLLTAVKANSAKMSYASSGNCSVLHMVGEQFKLATGTSIIHIPYKGSGPALNDLLGGQVDMMFDNLPSSMSHIKSRKLRALAVAWPTRIESLPDVPTFSELGYPLVNDPAWYGLVAPPKTPSDIINKLYKATAKALSSADVKERLQTSGAQPVGNTPAEYAAEIKATHENMRNVVIKQGIKFDGS